jgi:asparagine synthase (glutamine-hydrolysing)
MCGINGIFGIEKMNDARGVIQKMNSAISHRGPDADGIYEGNNVILGHRRLSIIDLSVESNQPFFSDDKRYIIVFNGEIYNYNDLKSQLSDFHFRTKSDTEVLLNGFRKWGIDFISRLEGMFAFAIWDTLKSELFIARDRLGIKPIYFFKNNDTILFSSEIRALLTSNLIQKKINKSSLIDYLRYQTVHAPQTMIQGVEMLMPGHWMLIKEKAVQIAKYWSLDSCAEDISKNVSYEEVKNNIYSLFEKSVKKRLVADVPFGAFLSGGIDSSAVVAMMARNSSKPVKTFCISFDESEFSEAKFAKIVSDKYATDHQEIRLSPDDFLKLMPGALAAMDHPSGDGPNTFVVSKVTKEAGITMALSGLGGDELFAGYDLFMRLKKIESKSWLQFVPSGMRGVGANFLQKTKPSVSSDKLSEFLRLNKYSITSVYPLMRKVLTENKIKELIGNKQLSTNRVEEIVENLIGKTGLAKSYSDLSKISISELSTYLQNVLLRDVDQMSMAHALEVRVPFMDHDLVSYVLGVKDEFKTPYSPKKLFVDSMGELIPSEIVNRPKMGFVFPWDKWMRNELKVFCEERIISLSKRNIFNSENLIQHWNQFLKNDKRVTWSRIWYLVVLEDWLIRNNIQTD